MKTIENKTSLLLDLFFCVVLLPVLIILGPVHHWFGQWPVFFFVACFFLYGCYFVLLKANVPKMLISRKYARIAVTIGVLVVLNWLLSLYPLPAMEFVTPAMSEYQTQVRNFGVSVTLWLMFSLVTGYGLTISFVKELYQQLLLKKQIEAQRRKAELAVFKAQISPHFLFNTLNSLYSLVIGTSEKAENAFIKFTDILKYTYVTIEKEAVTLAEEIAYIGSYIDLQQIRLNAHTTVDWDCEVDDDTLNVPPMLMLTFVENAFKYGVSASKDCRIGIYLSVKEGILRFCTSNRIMKHADEFRENVPVGIENCRSRLESLFPERHTLDIGEKDGIYKVDLTLQLD